MTKEEAEMYIADTAAMTLEFQGALTLLRAHDRKTGWIPASMEGLARLCGVSRRRMQDAFWPALSRFFGPVAGFPERLAAPENELARAKDAGQSVAQSGRAIRGWERRRGYARGNAAGNAGGTAVGSADGTKQPGVFEAVGIPAAMPAAMPGHTEPPKKEEFPPHTPLSEEKITPGSSPAEPDDENGSIYTDDFEEFWAAYPKRVGKGAAFKAWKKIKPSARLLGIMIAAVGRALQGFQWKQKNGAFIPHPATWLNERRWDDEADIPGSHPPQRSRTVENLPPLDEFEELPS